MRAVITTAYGPPEVLEVREVERPTPRSRHVRIRVVASAVTTSDCIARRSQLPLQLLVPMRLILGIRRPSRRPIPGVVLAGEVEAVGRACSRFEVGDRVFGYTGLRFGAHADYACLPEGGVLARMPAGLAYADAAAIVYGGLLALHFLTKAGLRAGQRVLVYGASGAIGSAAVQLARARGARVSGVCGPTNIEPVRSLGAAQVIDYTADDTLPDDERYDIVFYAVGRAKTLPLKEHARRALTAGGTYVSVDDGTPATTRAQLDTLVDLVSQGEFEAVIDRSYPLEETDEANRYVETGHKRGNVVLAVGGSSG